MTIVSLYFLSVIAWTQTHLVSSPPAGFEEFLGPQKALVDVYYGGERVTQVNVSYTYNWIVLSDAESLTQSVPGLKPKSSARVTQTLSGQLKTNSELVCARGVNPLFSECGQLSPQVAGVIFDSGRLRLHLFISKDHLVEAQNVAMKYYRSNGEQLSVLSTVGMSYGSIARSDSSKDENYSASATLSIGRIRNHIYGLGRYSSDIEKIDLDELYHRYQREKYVVRTGLIQTNLFELLPSQEIGGIEYQTNLQSRVNLDEASGSDIYIYLDRRSQVQVFRGNLLLSTEILPAGNHRIKTSSFPQGAYELRLRIISSRGEREERRFFVKSLDIPPKDSPVTTFRFGALQNPNALQGDVDFTGQYLGSFSHARRLNDHFGADLGVIANSRDTIGTFSLLTLWRALDLRLGSYYAKSKSRGASMQIAYLRGDWTWNSLLSQVWSGDEALEEDNFLLQRELEYRQIGLTSTVNLGESLLSIAGSLRETGKRTYSLSPRLRINLGQVWNGVATLTLQSNFATGGESTFSVGFGLFERFTSRLTSEIQGSMNSTNRRERYGNRELFGAGSANLNYSKRSKLNEEYGVRGQYDYRPDQSALELAPSYKGVYGVARVGASITDTDTVDRQDLTVNAQLNIAGGEGLVSGGGIPAGESAVIVKVDGGQQGQAYRILVNGSPSGFVRSGGTSLISLPSYQSYQIGLEAVGGRVVRLDQKTRSVTLLPGSVRSLFWKAKSYSIIVAQVLRAGKPLSSQRITLDEDVIVTDQYGYLQAELPEDTKLLAFPGCRVRLPPFGKSQVVALGQLNCE